ncbi:hypothetical protein [Streptomyces mobaraensis]|uniref:Uncharacterized protein n=1 Tax=Streptomyces mobaraensis TaxID=35621 RepID=A0A5N5W1C3_STRMB|nr:hypothetical protein [Streptomyces mobaraensis]KAB7835697.1 hypothetical protein FRZ00_26095 [Streptomyces mobaraensis]
MSRIAEVVLLAALSFTALAWALDLGNRKTQLMIATCVVLALDAAAIWQDKPWYICAVYGGLMGLLLPALRRESIRRKAAKTVSKPTF